MVIETALRRLGSKHVPLPGRAAARWIGPCKQSHRWWEGRMRRGRQPEPNLAIRLDCRAATALVVTQPARCEPRTHCARTAHCYCTCMRSKCRSSMLLCAYDLRSHPRGFCMQGAQSHATGSRAASVRSRATVSARRASDVSRSSQQPKVRPFASGLSATPRRLRAQSSDGSERKRAAARSAAAQLSAKKQDAQVWAATLAMCHST